jgi:mono/diheme cytochrome c family protein
MAMKKFIKRTSLIAGGLLVLFAVAGLTLYSTGIKKLNQTYPNLAVETINIPTDADAIARGRHVAVIWACTKCHGEELSGMTFTRDPLSGLVPLGGKISASNLTSGMGGIADAYADTDWVRAVRHGVMPDGSVEVFMFDYSTMSDQDLGDLIAYLKQVPPVDASYSEIQYGLITPVVSNIGLLMPAAERIDHSMLRSVDPAPDATVEYGKYLSTICTACHGNSIGNSVKKWNQDEFISIFHTGLLSNGKQFGATMSSSTFREMTDMELAALWLYFTNSNP